MAVGALRRTATGGVTETGRAGPEPTPPTRTRPRRRRRIVLGTAAVAVLGSAGLLLARGAGTGAESAGETAATTKAEVVRRDLVVTDSFTGALGFGKARSYVSERSGVVTSVAAAGTSVKAGEALFGIDREPTVVLTGSVPAYRALSTASASGPDIAQLEQGLTDLGYGSGVIVDEVFDSSTAAAVKSWEEALGRGAPDGAVAVGDVVFATGPVRVKAVTADVGSRVQSGTTMLSATASTQIVAVDLDARRSNALEPGTAVKLTMPDGKETTGKVAVVGVATESTSGAAGGTGGGAGGGGGGGGPTVPVDIRLDDPAAAAAFDSGSVDVAIERSRQDGATAVPVTALVALAEGGYALQVVDDSEPHGYRLVGVEVGTFADGFVGVQAENLEPGIKVVVPA